MRLFIALALSILTFCATGCASITKADRLLYDFHTNIVEVVKKETAPNGTVSYTTNLAEHVDYIPRAATESIITTVGGVIGGLFGMGGLVSTALGGLYALYAKIRSKKVALALVQTVETSREILKNTPQGAVLDQKLAKWMAEHQDQAGVLDAVLKLVGQVDGAKAMAAAKAIHAAPNE